MRIRLLLAAAAALVGAVAWAQLRITSLSSDGNLTWTNSARAGAYRVEWTDSPVGQWRAFDTQTNLNSIWVLTNRVAVQVPLSNTPTLYRVGWTLPEALGLWDYWCYNTNGTLIATGQLNFAVRTVLGTNPLAYGYSGSRNVQPAEPSASGYPFLIGTGDLTGTLIPGYAQFDVAWPPGWFDAGLENSGTIWPNTYTGSWHEVTIWGGYPCGTFRAEKH